MSYLTIEAINNWLAATKYEVESVNASMVDLAKAKVFGALDLRYDITPWVDRATTPEVVVSVMSMLVAAWEYDRAVAEDDGESDSYAVRLERRAMSLLDTLSGGVIDIPGVAPDTSTSVGMWPTDDSTTLALTSPEDPNASPQIFSMGMTF